MSELICICLTFKQVSCIKKTLLRCILSRAVCWSVGFWAEIWRSAWIQDLHSFGPTCI